MDELTQKWDNFVTGDDEAFTCLYKKFTSLLYEYGMRFTSDSDLVKDCIHDLFLTLYKNKKTLPKPQNIKVYLLVSLKNRLFNAFKHDSYTDNIEDDFTFNLIDSVEEEYIGTETDANLKKAVEIILSTLSARQKEIIYYRYIQELEMNEICELMGITYQSAQNLIQKAFHKVRNEKEKKLPGFSFLSSQKEDNNNLTNTTIKLLTLFF